MAGLDVEQDIAWRMAMPIDFGIKFAASLAYLARR